MLFWKIDEETIRCLINRDEIGQMGYDLDRLTEDHMQMDEFLDAIVKQSKNYLNWNTDNGIQTYVARALPADQFLVTISCTFADVMIDRDLDQIRSMMEALKERITEERIAGIYALSGQDKEEAFQELAADLHEICTGSPPEEGAGTRPQRVDREEEDGLKTGPHKLIFHDFEDLVRFCKDLDRDCFFPSSLYRDRDRYLVLVTFPGGTDPGEAGTFLLAAAEYGAACTSLGLEADYYKEHGNLLIAEDALGILHGF